MKTKLVMSVILVTGLFFVNYELHHYLSAIDASGQATAQVEQNARTQSLENSQLKDLITPALSIAGLIGVCTIFGKPDRRSNMWESWFLQGRRNATA